MFVFNSYQLTFPYRKKQKIANEKKKKRLQMKYFHEISRHTKYGNLDLDLLIGAGQHFCPMNISVPKFV